MIMSETSISNNRLNIRKLFLNLFTIFFIIMCYVYGSDYFGSISTPYLELEKITEFSIIFGFTLLLFTFFSIIAGPMIGFISGFFAELIYQLGFYHYIYLEWCFIIATIGLIFGAFRYKPLKHLKVKKFISEIIIFCILSLINAGILVTFLFLFNINQPISNLLIIRYGLMFFIEELVSIIIIVPLILYLYDLLLAKKERFIYHELLTHHLPSASDHTFFLMFGRTRIFFCSRCSGVIIGGLVGMFLTYIIPKIFSIIISPEIAVLCCILLPIPGLTDWGTQRLLLRKSSTESRLFTGFIIGIALHLMSFTSKYSLFMLLLLIIDFSILGALMYLGMKKEKKRLKAELQPSISEDINNKSFN